MIAASALALFLGAGAFTSETAAQTAAGQAALRARAYDFVYNLDYDEAIAAFREAVAADPDDAAGWRGLAATAWIQTLFGRGSILVDDYLGVMSRAEVAKPPPPPDLSRAFRESIGRALAIAEPRRRLRPGDAAACYDVGAALALSVSWTATVDGKVLAAVQTARRAFSEHERALELDPSRHDAALVAGAYRYTVSQLSAPLRWLSWLGGFPGGKRRGIQLIEQAAANPSDVQADAQFALVVVYNREGRPRDALEMIDRLRARFPRNRLLWLEYGASAIRAGLGVDAERELSQGLVRFAGDTRPRAPGEEARWHLALGAARLLLGRADAAMADLRAALALGPRDWILGRIHIELGKAADVGGDRASANTAYQAAIFYCERDGDSAGATEARRLLARPSSRSR